MVSQTRTTYIQTNVNCFRTKLRESVTKSILRVMRVEGGEGKGKVGTRPAAACNYLGDTVLTCREMHALHLWEGSPVGGEGNQGTKLYRKAGYLEWSRS